MLAFRRTFGGGIIHGEFTRFGEPSSQSQKSVRVRKMGGAIIFLIDFYIYYPNTRIFKLN